MSILNRNKDYTLEFERAVKQHLNGQISFEKLESAHKKFDKKARKENGGANMDFFDLEAEKSKRAKNFIKAMNSIDMSSLDAKGWKKLKKEANIASSGSFKKADASVSKHLKAYQSAHTKYLKSASAHPEGDTKLAGAMLVACENLDAALAKFISSKEFKNDLAQNLKKLCEDMRTRLARDKQTYARIANNGALAAKQMKQKLAAAGLKL